MKYAYLLAALAAAAAAQPAYAEAGDIILRGRVIQVHPLESSSDVLPAFPGEEVKVSNAWTLEVDGTYMVTNHIGVELIAATTKHKVSGRTGTTGSIGKLASTWVLPPTLTAQYHFLPGGRIRPYVGVGINYSLFYSEKASDGLEDAVGDTDVELSDSFGPALQGGVDIDVSKNIFLNLDVKWIDMDTTAKLHTEAIGRQKVNVHLDPLVFGVGVGKRF